MKYLLILLSLCFHAQAQMYDDVTGHFRVNAKEMFHVIPGQPTTIEVWFTDSKSGEVLKDYRELHGKLMHMVLIKKDLSVFKHIHPYYEPVSGRFQITLNMPLSDPDNFQTANALTEPGMYMLMADVEPKGYGMRMSHIMLHAHGQSARQELQMDPVVNNLIVKEFKQYDRDLKLELDYINFPGCNGHLVEFMTTLYEKDSKGDYQPADEIEPWLGAGAHSVWVSEGMMGGPMKMHYAHMHSKIPEEGSSHIFSFHDLNIMKPGPQKIWFQIKQKGQILTVPVVFDYQVPSGQGNCR